VDVLKRSVGRFGVAAILTLGAACSDPDAYRGGGRAQTLPVEGGGASTAGDDASDSRDGGTADSWTGGGDASGE
jgi:hypothetical protein